MRHNSSQENTNVMSRMIFESAIYIEITNRAGRLSR